MIVKDNVITERYLYCRVCETWTKHVLSGSQFVCGCGCDVVIVRAAEKPQKEKD